MWLLPAVGVAQNLQTEDTWCASCVPDPTSVSPATEGIPVGANPGVEPDDEVRALFVFARFTDEFLVGAPCSPDPWPPELTVPPAWGFDLLEDTVTPVNPQSMTTWFQLMSNGHHILRGTTYPEVVVAPKTLQQYFDDGEGFTDVNHDILEIIDPQVDFDQYDMDQDGMVDFVFVLYRQKWGTGASIGSSFAGFSHIGTVDFVTNDLSSFTGQLVVVGPQSGATMTPAGSHRGLKWTRDLALHEYVHDLNPYLGDRWPGGHLRSIGPYGVMDGTAAFDVMGRGAMSTIYRKEFGWVAPKPAHDIVLNSPGDEVTIELTDVLTTGADGYAVVRTLDPNQFFLLECRDRSATRFTNGGLPEDPCRSDLTGFDGLLITHNSEYLRDKQIAGCVSSYVPNSGWWLTPGGTNDQNPPACSMPGCVPDFTGCCPNQTTPPAVDVELASGMFHDLTWAPDPIRGWDRMSLFENDAYQNDGPRDFFHPGGVNAFTPYTSPNTNLYHYPQDGTAYHDLVNCPLRQDQTVYSGLSFFNIEWAIPPGNGQGKIRVTIRYDGDTPPPAGTPFELPDGMHVDGTLLVTADVEVPAGHTVTMQPGSRFVAAANQDAQAAGDDPSQVELLVSGNLQLLGTGVEPVQFTSSRDPGFVHSLGAGENGNPATTTDWSGIRLAGGVSADLAYLDVRHAEIGVALSHNEASVTDSLFTDCETGVLAVDAIGDGVEVLRNVVSGGDTGIWSFECEPLRIEDNLVSGQASVGIRFENSRNNCLQASVTPRDSIIKQNVVTGTGIGAGGANGIEVVWGCAPGERTLNVNGNEVLDWDGAGLFLYECADVNFRCNVLEHNRLAVEFFRTSVPSGGDVTFQTNRFTAAGTSDGLLDTNYALHLKLFGSNPAQTGKNIFDLAVPATQFFVNQNGVPGTDTLFVNKNYWKFAGVKQTDSATILAEFEGGSGSLVLLPLANTPEPPCITTGPSSLPIDDLGVRRRSPQ